MSSQPADARAPFAVRAAMVVIAVITAVVAVLAAINLYAVVSCNDASRALSENLTAAADDATDLEMLRIRQQQVDDQLDGVGALSSLLLPQVRQSVETNLNASQQLTQRTVKEIERQQQGDSATASTGQPLEGQDAEDALSGGGLTADQRQRIEELLQANQASTPSESTDGEDSDGGQTDGDTQSTEVKPW